ncbi:hypothetical protein [Salmonirosea aquatica]|uniref:Glycosyltransferase n=1 Tax=Salmonirosea aquatica TaxID=2654236 RepID=A0A7C9FSM5_9BACT|nr:hypothetical protein [Cytophagaceae bacterium SJW1-29]
MQVVLISKYFVPDRSVDAVSVSHLISALIARDPHIEIHIVTTNHNYKNEPEKVKAATSLETLFKVHRVNSLYGGNNKYLLLIGAVTDGLRLVLKARRLQIPNVISLTNPPLITFWCAMLLRRRNWLYWTFDLYPDALKASHILSGKSLFYRLIESFVYNAPPSTLISLGKKQYAYLTDKYEKEVPWICLPCGILPENSQTNKEPPDWFVQGKYYVGYLGNIGKAHSKDFIIEFVKNFPALEGYTLVLAVYGEHRLEIENFVKKSNFDNVVLVGKVERQHLHLIDIHLVSLLEEWTHISVPSKAVSAVCVGSALIFYGSRHSDTWDMFKECSFFVDRTTDLASLLSSILPREVEEKKSKARKIAMHLIHQQESAYDQILASLKM